MSRAETEYLKLVFDYEVAVEAYTATVYALLDANSLLVFNQAMEAVNVGHTKCQDLRTRLHEARKKSDANSLPTAFAFSASRP